MGKIGLIDVDGHNFPNLALMRISQFHKQQGDEVEWWQGNFFHYDKVYQSKVFSNNYTEDIQEVTNADEMIKGGTGYAISLQNGIETFDKSKDINLVAEIEKCKPDYSIYPEYDFAISMTSRGCPRGCPFCHVAAKEGRKSCKVADVMDFYEGQKRIQVLDPNITACNDKRDLFAQYKDTKATITFSQGLDIRLLNEADIDDLKQMKLKNLHFAWDNAKEDLTKHFERFAEQIGKKTDIATVYVLTNFNSTREENLYRVQKLKNLGYYPYVMIYNKPTADKELLAFQRWVNTPCIFKSCKDFNDYTRKNTGEIANNYKFNIKEIE